MSVLADIRSAIVTQFNTMNPINVAWENVSFNPNGKSWLRFSFLPQSIDQIEYGTYADDLREGIAQIDVFEPLHSGTETALSQAESVQAAFPRGKVLTYNSVKVQVYRSQIHSGTSDDAYYHVPVSVYWRTFTNPIGV